MAVGTRIEGVSTGALLGVLILPAFFPYVGVLKGVDMQPNGLLAMLLLVVIAAFIRPIRVSPIYVGLLGGTLVVAVCRLIYQFLVGDVAVNASVNVLAFAQTGFHIATILVAYLIVRSGMFMPTAKIIGLVLFVYVIFGVLQLLIDEQIGSALVYRGFESLADTGRGVRSLASEPAVFGNVLLILSGFLMLVAARMGWSSTRFLLAQAMILACTALLAQSTYAILVHSFVVYLCILVVSPRLFFLLCFATVWVATAFLLAAETDGIRALFVLQLLFENPVLLYEQGAMLRVMNVPISMYGGLMHGAFGSGFGSDALVVGQIPLLPGEPYPFQVSDRNLGGLVEFFLRMGIGALPLLVFFLIQIFRLARSRCELGREQVRIGLPLALTVFLTSYTYSSVGNPMVWLLFFSALEWRTRSATAGPRESR